MDEKSGALLFMEVKTSCSRWRFENRCLDGVGCGDRKYTAACERRHACKEVGIEEVIGMIGFGRGDFECVKS